MVRMLFWNPGRWLWDLKHDTLGFYALNCSSWCVAQDFDNECLLDVWNCVQKNKNRQVHLCFPLLSTMGCGESSELVSQHRSCTVWALKLYNSPGAQRRVLGESTGGRWNMLKLLGASWSPKNPYHPISSLIFCMGWGLGCWGSGGGLLNLPGSQGNWGLIYWAW